MRTRLVNALESDDVNSISRILQSRFQPYPPLQSLPPSSSMFGAFPIPLTVAAASCGSQNVLNLLIESFHCDPMEVDGNGNTILHAAAASADLNTFQYIMANADLLGATNNDGQAPLHIAASRGADAIVEFILSLGFPADIPDNNGQTPLFLASRYNWSAIVRVLMDHQALTSSASDGDNCMHTALMLRNEECVRELVLGYQLWEVRNSKGMTPLHIAVEWGRLDLVILFLENGASPLALTVSGQTILHLAAISKNPELVNFVIQNSPDMAAGADSKYYLPIHYAAQYGPLPSVQLLIPVSDLTDNNPGFTPAHLAVKHNHPDIFFALAEVCDVALPTYYEQSALHIAARVANTEMLLAILNMNIFDVNAADPTGWTPLHFAASRGTLAMVQTLLAHGADASLTDTENRTPCDVATARGANRIAKALPRHRPWG